MFVGHYGPSFAIKAVRRSIPLWLLSYVVFAAAAQWLDRHRAYTA